MLIEDWPLEKILPYKNNPRLRGKKAVAKVAASIKEFGVRQPIVVDENGEVLVGHTRRDIAAQSEGRRCYGLEIEPRYCDVIRARWEKFTGKTAVLEHREVAA